MTIYIILSIFALVFGLAFWYIFYGLELYMNGASFGKGSKYSIFHYLWEEFLWILPGGRKMKIKFCEDRDMSSEEAKDLPGVFHFMFTHILIPFGPTILLNIYYQNWLNL